MGLPDVIRVATGLIWAAFGAWLFTRRAAPPRAAPVALLLVGFGSMAAVGNVVLTDLTHIRVANSAQVALALVALGALLRLFRAEARLAKHAAQGCLAFGSLVGAAAGLASAAGRFSATPILAVHQFFFLVVAALMAAYCLYASIRAQEADRAEGRALAAIGGALGLYPITYFFTGAPSLPLIPSLELLAAAPMLPALVMWARARSGAAGTAATLAFGALLAAPLIALAVQAFGTRDTGIIGIVRVAALALLAYGVFAWSALGTSARPTRDHRAALLTAFLVVLLVVAQIAQNFLSAQYGLIMGGVVAGALVVAARPIERALEARRPTRAPQPDAAKEDAFRAAVRLALRDRRITREEELHLHRVAQHMGIPTGRAHELLIEVERDVREGDQTS